MLSSSDIFSTYKNRSENWIKKKDPTFHSFIFSSSDLEISWREKLYLHYYNLSLLPNCYCGNKVKFINITKGYRKYCSNYCKSNDPELFELTKKKNIDKWGVDNPMKLLKFRKKQKQSFLTNYGSNFEEIKQKVIHTNRQRWGVDFISQSPEKKKILSEKMKSDTQRLNAINKLHLEQRLQRKFKKLNLDFISILDTSIYMALCTKGHKFEIHKNMLNDRTRNKNTICTTCNPIKSGSDSEVQLFQLIERIYTGKIIRNYRDTYEIDIFLPDLNIGFEFNGIYWHSSIYRDKSYHTNKLSWFINKGIQIFYIWEDEWLHNYNRVKSSIESIICTDITIENINVKEEKNVLYINDHSFLKYDIESNYIVIVKAYWENFKQIQAFIEYLKNKNKMIVYRNENMLLGYILKKIGFQVTACSGPVVEFFSTTKRLKLESNTRLEPVRLSQNINFVWMNSLERLSLNFE